MKTKKKFINQLKWDVFDYGFNEGKIEHRDVFRHTSFLNDVVRAFEKTTTFESFQEKLKADIQYYFWGRCEYEILIAGWPPTSDRSEEIKTDWAEQLTMNFSQFSTYVWNVLRGTYPTALMPKITRTIYTVGEELMCDSNYESKIFLQTTNLDEALKRYNKEKRAVLKEEDFFLRNYITENYVPEDGASFKNNQTSFNVSDEEGNWYALYISETKFDDWG